MLEYANHDLTSQPGTIRFGNNFKKQELQMDEKNANKTTSERQIYIYIYIKYIYIYIYKKNTYTYIYIHICVYINYS